MSIWLKEEIYPITELNFKTKQDSLEQSGYSSQSESGSIRKDKSGPDLFSISNPEKEYSIYLRHVKILNNKKLVGLSTAILHCIIVNGLPDMSLKKPFWSWQMSFPNVGDGTKLSIDSEFGVQVFNGKPLGFLNFYILASRDFESVREFTSLLQKNMEIKKVGEILGDLVPIFSSLDPSALLSTASNLATEAVQSTISYLRHKKDPIIGIYVATLPKEKDYGVGFHPLNYPDSLIDCQGTMEIGYEVTKHD